MSAGRLEPSELRDDGGAIYDWLCWAGAVTVASVGIRAPGLTFAELYEFTFAGKIALVLSV